MSTVSPTRKRARYSSSRTASGSEASGPVQTRLDFCSRDPSIAPQDFSSPSRSFTNHDPFHAIIPRVANPLLPESDEAVLDREHADALDEIVLALDMRGGHRGAIGACYYVARDEKLHIISDVEMAGVETVEAVRLQVQPTIILVTSRIDAKVEECLDPQMGNRGHGHGEDAQLHLPYVLETRPRNEFSYEAGIRKLIELPLTGDIYPNTNLIVPGDEDAYEIAQGFTEPGYTTRQGKLLRLSSIVDVESKLAIGCAAAVLTYLQRRRAVMFLPGDEAAKNVLRITNLEIVALNGLMLLNSDTLLALQIIQSESHPNAQNQGPSSSGAKEDISLYGLFHHLAGTPQGKRLLRQWFLRPQLDLQEITERHNTTSVFSRPHNDEHLVELRKTLRQIKNMRTVMLHLRKGTKDSEGKSQGVKNGVWFTIRSFMFHTIGICETLEQVMDARRLVVAKKVFEKFDLHQLALLGTRIIAVIDFPASADLHRTTVKTGFDEELDILKREFAGIDSLLNQASRDLADTIPQRFGLDLNVVFYPQLGFLICVPIDGRTGRAEWEGGSNPWEKIFVTPGRVYYKDSRMRGFDMRLGDMHAKICGKEIEIVYELAQQVLEHEEMLCDVSDVCGELDSLLALAQGAKQYRLNRPLMTSENKILIEEGRHLLQELTVPRYIANDTSIIGVEGSKDITAAAEGKFHQAGPTMLVLTGPNYSGKSVYMKQVAQIVYLAHVGCFVPATSATIGLTDKILTRVATRESVSRPQSSFAIDLQQIASSLSLATSRSLLLIDEFGKGTDTADGAGLVCGVLEYLLSREPALRPKVLAATHFHELFEAGFLKSRPGLALAHMDVRVDEEAVGKEQVTYLYSLRKGRSLASFGTVCARLNGIDQAVIDRANQLIELQARGGDLVAMFCKAREDEHEAKRERYELEQLEQLARAFLEKDFTIQPTGGSLERQSSGGQSSDGQSSDGQSSEEQSSEGAGEGVHDEYRKFLEQLF